MRNMHTPLNLTYDIKMIVDPELGKIIGREDYERLVSKSWQGGIVNIFNKKLKNGKQYFTYK
jgi:hypothetical protein